MQRISNILLQMHCLSAAAGLPQQGCDPSAALLARRVDTPSRCTPPSRHMPPSRLYPNRATLLTVGFYVVDGKLECAAAQTSGLPMFNISILEEPHACQNTTCTCLHESTQQQCMCAFACAHVQSLCSSMLMLQSTRCHPASTAHRHACWLPSTAANVPLSAC